MFEETQMFDDAHHSLVSTVLEDCSDNSLQRSSNHLRRSGGRTIRNKDTLVDAEIVATLRKAIVT